MKAHIRDLARFSDFLGGAEINEATIAKLAAVVITQAHHVVVVIRESVVPLLPPAKRAFAESIARNIESGPIFQERVLRDLATFESTLAQRIEAGTHRFWHGDENHCRGGYASLYREDEACELAEAAAKLALLSDMISTTLSVAEAMRQAGSLIDK